MGGKVLASPWPEGKKPGGATCSALSIALGYSKHSDSERTVEKKALLSKQLERCT